MIFSKIAVHWQNTVFVFAILSWLGLGTCNCPDARVIALRNLHRCFHDVFQVSCTCYTACNRATQCGGKIGNMCWLDLAT